MEGTKLQSTVIYASGRHQYVRWPFFATADRGDWKWRGLKYKALHKNFCTGMVTAGSASTEIYACGRHLYVRWPFFATADRGDCGWRGLNYKIAL